MHVVEPAYFFISTVQKKTMSNKRVHTRLHTLISHIHRGHFIGSDMPFGWVVGHCLRSRQKDNSEVPNRSENDQIQPSRQEFDSVQGYLLCEGTESAWATWEEEERPHFYPVPLLSLLLPSFPPMLPKFFLLEAAPGFLIQASPASGWALSSRVSSPTNMS